MAVDRDYTGEWTVQVQDKALAVIDMSEIDIDQSNGFLSIYIYYTLWMF